MNAHFERVLDDPVEIRGTRSSAALKKRRVLVISYDFPPNRTSAVYRMTGLTKYLTQFGWQPTVLTIRAEEGAQEPKLLEKLPAEVKIVRTKLVRINGWENRAASAIVSAGALRSTAGDQQPTRDRYLRFLGELLRSTLYFPDETAGWIPFAFAEAVKLHHEQPFDAVYTTSPPRAASVVGLLLKVFYRIPWVCEFMDPWYPPKGRLRKKAEDRLQALLVHKADRFVVMVQQHADELRHLFQARPEKLAVVRNGFFEEDFAASSSEQSPLDPAYFHFSHFGSIYPQNDGSFFTALSELVRERPELRERIRVNIGGYPSESVLRYARESELKDIIQLRGFLPDRADILQMMRASDCLLLFWGRSDFSRLAVAGKTYDSLRIGRPILAVTAEGGVKELVEEAQAGLVVPPDNVAAIKQGLEAMIRNQHRNGLPRPPRPDFVAQFTWERLAGNLAEVLEGAVDGAR
jgi:glycosyltransferase involved in cell wall biosynthesis